MNRKSIALAALVFFSAPGWSAFQVWGGDRFCMVVMWGKKGAEAMNDGGCEAR